MTSGVCLALLMSGCTASQACPKEGEQAPDFTLQSIDGNNVSLSDFRGKTVLIYLWATTCQTCLETEMPHLQTIYNKSPNNELIVLAVNDFNSPKTVRDEVERRGFTFLFLLDPQQIIRKQYICGIGYPVIVIISPDGTYKKKHAGQPFESQQELQSWLESP
jgi:peroxiredoxin